jgi:hypothetical protein
MDRRDCFAIAFIFMFYASCFLFLVCFLSPKYFYSVDEGMRYIQTVNYLNKSFLDRSIDYPIQLDPTFEHVASPFLFKQNGVLVSQYSSFLPYVNSYLFLFFGFPGLYLIPILSSLLAIFLLYFLLKKKYSFTLALCGCVILSLASPFLFYTFTTWDHTFAVLLSMLFIVCADHYIKLRKKSSFCALVLISMMSFIARSETLLIYLAFFASLFIITRNHPRVGAFKRVIELNYMLIMAIVCCVVLLIFFLWDFIFNFLIYHFYIHVIARFSILHIFNLENKYQILNLLLFSNDGALDLSFFTALVFVLVASIAVLFIYKRKKTSVFLMSGILFFLIVYSCFMSYVIEARITGFFVGFPIALAAILLIVNIIQKSNSFTKFVSVAFLLSLLLFLFIPSGGGKQWGGRYLLPLIPLVCIIVVDSLKSLSNKKFVSLLIIVLIIASFFIQCLGIHNRFKYIQIDIDTERVLSHCDYILSDNRFMGILYPGHFLNGTVFYCNYTKNNCPTFPKNSTICYHTVSKYVPQEYINVSKNPYSGDIFFTN